MEAVPANIKQIINDLARCRKTPAQYRSGGFI